MLVDILAGMVTAGFAVAALFFLRFWRDTRDTLFLHFAAAFLLLGISQLILALGSLPDEHRAWVYLVRLAAFLLILGGILRKNRR
jgi:membrane-associated PAP2 superfamily phosphatase